MKTSMCENCIKHKTIYCPNSDKCLAREDKPFYEDKYTILTRNEALEGVLKDYKEEIAYKLIELYYTNSGIFKSYCISLKDIAEKYNQILEILK